LTDTPQLGELVATRRERRALTMQALAGMVGVSRHSVSNWEHGHALPALRMIRDQDAPGPLAVALEIDWQELAYARANDNDLRRIRRANGR
jgi:transcriptional regulator with XRE-family HTH domain